MIGRPSIASSLVAALLVAGASRARADWDTATQGTCRASSAAALRDNLVDGGDTFAFEIGRVMESPDTRIATCRASSTMSTDDKAKLDACVARVKAYAFLVSIPGLGLVRDPTASPLVAISTDDYVAAYGTDQLAIPGALADAELFQLLLDTNLSKIDTVRRTVAKIVELVPGAVVVPYVSQTTPSIDNTSGAYKDDRRGRIVVALPKGTGTLDKYVQFSVNANPATPATVARTQASIVSFEDGVGSYVFDWARDGGRFIYRPGFGNDQKCYQCHASGMLEIHPFQTSDDDVGGAGAGLGDNYPAWLDPLNREYADNVRALNRQARDQFQEMYGAARRVRNSVGRDQLVPGAMFPNGLAEPSAFSSDCQAAVDGLREKLTTARWLADWARYAFYNAQIIAGGRTALDIMEFSGSSYEPDKGDSLAKCSACHTARGSSIYEAPSFDDMMTKYVAGGSMPPRRLGGKNTVDLSVRRKVAQCYKDQLDAAVKAWLKGTGDCK